MQFKADLQTSPTAPSSPLADRVRRPYVAPALEPLGAWSTLTLQQSVPIGPGSLFGLLGDNPRHG